MASSRKTGTNESVATYGTGKTYTALATWEGDTDVNCVTGTTSYVLEVYGNSYNDSITLAGATCNASYFRIIRPASGNFLTSGAISTKHFADTSATGSPTFYINAESYTQVQDLVVTKNVSSSSNRNVFETYGDSTGCGFIGCVAIDSTNSGTGTTAGFVIQPATTAGNKHFVINCLAHNCESDGFRLASANNAYPIAYNCTATNNGAYGFNGNSSTYCILKNCGATGNSTAEIEDATFSETNDSESAPTFVNSAGDDFHLSAADSTWKTQGGDLSGDANYAFDDDIDKNTRSDWSIGWDEVVAGGSSASASPSASPSASASASPSASASGSPSASVSASPSASASASPSASESASPSASASASPSASPSASASASPSASASASPSAAAAWYNASSYSPDPLTYGAVTSGSIDDTWTQNGTSLLVAEHAGDSPGFEIDFIFGEDESVPTTSLYVNFYAFYEGNPAHIVNLYQWNYNTTTWTQIDGGQAFPDAEDFGSYQFLLVDNANYISGGQIKIRVSHAGTGSAGHTFYVDHLYLSLAPSESPSASASASPSASASASPSASPSASASASPSVSPSASASASPSASPSSSPSPGSSPSASPSASISPSPSASASASPSASASASPSASISPSPSASVSASPSASPSASASASPSASPSASASASPSASISPSPSASASASISASPSASPSRSASASPSASPSSSPSLGSSASASPSASPSVSPSAGTPVPWYYASGMTVITGSIFNGTLDYTYTLDGYSLMLNESIGAPGLLVDFTFGDDEAVPTTDLTATFYYAANDDVHNKYRLEQYNYTLGEWYYVTTATNDFPYNSTITQSTFTLLSGADYTETGKISLRISHNPLGSNAHYLVLDYIILSAIGTSASASPSASPSYSGSASPSASPSASASASPSASVSPSPSAGALPELITPTFAITSITSTSFVIYWTGNVDGDDPPTTIVHTLDSSLDPTYLSYDPIATLTTSPQTITGLTAGTKYHLKVHDQRTAYGITGYDDIASDVLIISTVPKSNMDFQLWYECPVCGFEFRKRDLHKRWDGLLVCWKDLDERNPQDTR